MTATFVVAAALLVAFVLALVVRPLWRDTRGVAVALGVTVVCSAAALYLLVGTPAALDPAARTAPATLADAISRLEAQLRTAPTDIEGWRLLGRAYLSEQQPVQARGAFARAAVLAPDDPDVLAEAAEASALADPQRRFDARSVAWLRHALEVQPRHQRARWLLGVAQRQAGQAADAAKTWEPLLAEVDAKTAVPLREQVDAARAAAGMPPLPASAAPANAASLAVQVRLDPKLAARVGPDASVFVIARMPGGPPMPIAVERHAARELPFTATLDDGDSPMPTGKLSAQREVELVARVSQAGDAMPQAGDLESAPVRVALPASKPATLAIDHVRE
ncbi:MAG: cytochrome C biogenesis protein [Lysobacter sp.]|nr:cytochrome C biogenesis protein [Lysobacter sp.]